MNLSDGKSLGLCRCATVATGNGHKGLPVGGGARVLHLGHWHAWKPNDGLRLSRLTQADPGMGLWSPQLLPWPPSLRAECFSYLVGAEGFDPET